MDNPRLDWGAVVVDNFFTPDVFDDLTHGEFVTVDDVEQDIAITKRRKRNIRHEGMMQELQTFMYSDWLRTTTSGIPDLAWRIVYNQAIKQHETAISTYAPGQAVKWHVDHGDYSRVFLFVVALNMPRGGAFEWNHEPLPNGEDSLRYGGQPLASREPILNQLILLPAWFPHRVMEAETQREVLHGHFNI